MVRENKKKAKGEDCWNTIGVWSRAEKKCEELAHQVHCRNCPVFSVMGRSVFEQSAPSGYLSQWRKAIALKASVDDAKTNSVLVFRVAREWFALPAKILSEVSNQREIHRIPRNMNRFISGIVNINGEIKICYSLEELLGVSSEKGANKTHEEIDIKNPKRLIVIELDEVQYVFLVDEVKGLHWYGDSELLSVPSTIEPQSALLLLGAVDKFEHKIAIFNIEKFQEKLEGTVL